MEHAIAENVIAGNAMTRRATYQFGAGLTPGVRGHVDTGLGKALGSGGLSLIAPTDTVPDNANLTIDGIEIDFQMAHGTEAESEMMMYFPQFRVLNTAEITSQHLHNIYTIRGAAIRDASSWSRFIDKVLVRFADRTDILVAQHHWPIWNPEDITHFLEVQRDLYKYIDMSEITPSLLHGDLWSGNILFNIKSAYLIDPAIYFGDREMELAFILLFDTFGETFFRHYAEVHPLSKTFHETKVPIYQIYPLLVHVAIYGESYLPALEKRLLKV